jgi:hypothetical protein
MSLLKIGFASAAAYVLYRYATSQAKNSQSPQRVAFASGESVPGGSDVRNAGPAAMASAQPKWDATDQASDESYPASDPPASNRFT